MRDRGYTHFVLRKIIGKLANLTPSVVYYAEGWPAKINGIQRVIGAAKGDKSPLTTASIAMACAMHEHLKVGDTAEISLVGVTRGNQELGDFEVTVRRTKGY